MITTIIPEFILFLIEYPLGTILTWLTLSITWFFGEWLTLLAWFIIIPLACITALVSYLVLGSRLLDSEVSLSEPYKSWIKIKDPELMCWKGKKIPIREAYEWYFLGKINFTKPLLEIFINRKNMFRMIFTWNHIWEFMDGVIRKAWLNHDNTGDSGEVCPVYNLGNDFYHAFLADPMLYSCGIAYNPKEDLKTIQDRKMAICCERLQLKDGDRLIDFGCGWGSWLIYAASHFKIDGIGITISQNQYEWATKRVKEEKLQNYIKIILLDYRLLTAQRFGKFDKITCFEMSEHVGIRNYQKFIGQIKSLLKQDGLFFLQIAGLRRTWNYEDLIWGVFMGKYIFPGADASCPLYWDVNQVERGGFEVHSVKNQGVHYAYTIEKWYDNIIKKNQELINKYGLFAYRRHELFLAWSTMIARQGSSTVYCILCSHNTNVDQYSELNSSMKLNRTEKFMKKNFFTTKH